MKKLIKMCFLSLAFIFFSNALAKERLIFDQTPAQADFYYPEHFRIFGHALGSAQFNREQLTHVLERIHGKNIYDVDLRQETHAFVNNGTPVSLYGERDWGNKGLSDEVLAAKQKQFIAQLNQSEKGVMTEEQLVTALKLHYENFPVTDHMMPSIEQVNRFLAFYRQLPPNAWIYFHCHGGDGRTTTFLALYDILQNAQKDSLDTILARQYKLDGVNLAKIPPGRPDWYTQAAKDRLAFLQRFYQYVRSGNYQKGLSFS